MMKPPLRDTRQPREYWDDMAIRLDKFLSHETALSNYEIQLEREGSNGGNALAGYADSAVFNNLLAVNYFYSRGDDLSDIRSKALEVALENTLFVQKEMLGGQGKEVLPDYTLHRGMDIPASLHSAYVMLCWCVCLEADTEVMKRLVTMLAPTGEDRLLDVVLQRYGSEHVVASESAAPKVFGLLDQVIDADETQRIKLLVKYLNNWGKTMSKLKGLRSLGGADQARRAKSNKDLGKEDIMRPDLLGYKGWWAWEVALVVRVFGIDDSSFADHVLYPVDMVRYRHADKTVDLWPIEHTPTAIGGVLATDDPFKNEFNSEYKPMITELFVAINLAITSTAPVMADNLFEDPDYPDYPDELYYYAAVDKSTGVVKQEPTLIITDMTPLKFKATKGSDPHQVKLAEKEIDKTTEYLSGYHDRYLPHRETLDESGVTELLDYFEIQPLSDGSRGVYLPVDSGPGWASWIDVSEYKNSTTILTVEYKRVNAGKVIEITATNSGRPDVTLGALIAHWEELVEQYSDIPL